LYYVYSRDIRVGYGDKAFRLEWPIDMCNKFLSIKPRPTMKELVEVVYPLGYDTRKHRYYIPNPERQGYLKYDTSRYIEEPISDRPGWVHLKDNPNSEYVKLLKQEAQRRIELMTQIIKSRGVDYDPAPILKQAKERYLQEQQEKHKQHLEALARHQDPKYKKRVAEEIAEVDQMISLEREEARKKRSERVKQWWASRR
jgi:tRNA uridine 5-carbamoylmethylation protein Kti12